MARRSLKGSGEESASILVVDDQKETCSILKEMIEELGYTAYTATSGKEALARLENQEFDLAIIDLVLKDFSGMEILKEAKNRFPLTEAIILTGYGTMESAAEALELGANSFIQKPITFSEIRIRIEQALAKRRFSLRTQELIRKVSRIGSELRRQAEQISVLYELGKKLTSSIDCQHVIDTTLEELRQMVSAQSYCLLSVEDQNVQLHILSGVIGSENYLASIKGNLLSFWNELNERELLPEAIEVSLKAKQKRGEEALKVDRVASTLTVPLMVQNKTIGLLNVSSSEPEVFTDDDLRLLYIVAHQVAVVIDNASLHQYTRFLALTDGLTGLLNHRTFQERLQSEFERSLRYGSFLSLIILDIDFFKQINDAYGHPQGDKVLKELANILRKSTRGVDILARYGGEEFVIILPETESANAELLAERIRETVKRHEFEVDGERLNLTISLGVASYPHPEVLSKGDLINRADGALYQAKEGRDRACVAA